MVDISNNIGVKLRNARLSKKLTQLQLAEIFDCSDKMISHLEKQEDDKKSILLEYIYFAKFLGIDLNDLFDDDYFEQFKNKIQKNKKFKAYLTK